MCNSCLQVFVHVKHTEVLKSNFAITFHIPNRHSVVSIQEPHIQYNIANLQVEQAS